MQLREASISPVDTLCESDARMHHVLALASISPQDLTTPQVEEVLTIASRANEDEAGLQAMVILSHLFAHRAPRDPAFARRAHDLLMRALRGGSMSAAPKQVNWLTIAHLSDSNLQHIPWKNVQEVVAAIECFYGVDTADMSAHDNDRRVRDIIMHACRYFITHGRWDWAFSLVSRVRLRDDLIDAELFHLLNMLNLYEQRRVKRFRRLMTITLTSLWSLIVLVIPELFLLAENGVRIAAHLQPLNWFQSLYWSIITATTVGYGDIVPMTDLGRSMAMINCLIGVTTIGVISGLMLSGLTTRRIV